MAAHIGVTELHGITVPEGGFAHESTKDTSVEIVTTKNNLGVTVFADLKPFTKSEISVKGVGDANFALVAADDFAPGTMKIISAKRSEDIDKRPEFEYTAVRYDNTAAE